MFLIECLASYMHPNCVRFAATFLFCIINLCSNNNSDEKNKVLVLIHVKLCMKTMFFLVNSINTLLCFRVSDGDTSCPKIEVVSMTTCMKYFGVSDLREILRLTTQNSSVTISGSRPSKVRHYIQVCSCGIKC